MSKHVLSVGTIVMKKTIQFQTLIVNVIKILFFFSKMTTMLLLTSNGKTRIKTV